MVSSSHPINFTAISPVLPVIIMVLFPLWATYLAAVTTSDLSAPVSVNNNMTTSTPQHIKSTSNSTNALLSRLLLARTLLVALNSNKNNNVSLVLSNNTISNATSSVSAVDVVSDEADGRQARLYRRSTHRFKTRKRSNFRRVVLPNDEDDESEDPAAYYDNDDKQASPSENLMTPSASDYEAMQTSYGGGGGGYGGKGGKEKKPYKVFLEIPRPKPHIIPPRIIQVPVPGPIIVPRIKIGYEVRKPPPMEKPKCEGYGCGADKGGYEKTGGGGGYGGGGGGGHGEEPSGDYSNAFGTWLKKGSFISFANNEDNDKETDYNDDSDAHDDYMSGGMIEDPFGKKQAGKGGAGYGSGGGEDLRLKVSPKYMNSGSQAAGYEGGKSSSASTYGELASSPKYEVSAGGKQQQNPYGQTLVSEETEKPQVVVKDYYFKVPEDEKYGSGQKPQKPYGVNRAKPSLMRGALITPDYADWKSGYTVRALSSERSNNMALRGEHATTVGDEDAPLAYYDSVSLSGDALGPAREGEKLPFREGDASSVPADFDITLKYDPLRGVYVPTYSSGQQPTANNGRQQRTELKNVGKVRPPSKIRGSYSPSNSGRAIRQTPYGDLIYSPSWTWSRRTGQRAGDQDSYKTANDSANNEYRPTFRRRKYRRPQITSSDPMVIDGVGEESSVEVYDGQQTPVYEEGVVLE